MITFDELVSIGRDTQATDLNKRCLICEVEPGTPCTESCDKRGEAAARRVRDLVKNLPGAQFEELLAVAREREASDDETPGFFWAWSAVDEEATARGLGRPRPSAWEYLRDLWA
ncbi:hypothetical protein HUT18_11685 [Streptomyces sp. NA04227]|uniref:hypothetical protein n=1 Tax=Streptomyces sp. NA04227 TaxID=2742136 RepID=UPI00159256AA|nr:hypothetical protein [Streptomyces sp. NA04227]QKW06959.1 hypothetical protein HUT18_11685 [Streptomyces sp. NA04227]